MKRKRTFKRMLVLRAAAIAVGVMPFVVLEFVLWGLDIPVEGRALSRIAEANGSRQLFRLNPESQRYEIASERLEFFRPESFPKHKASNHQRVFVLGGSTVQGRPYEVETAFSTWLELTLGALDESQNWEVINCGGVSYASYRVAAVLDEILHYEPDLVILYTGHNEFLEHRELGQYKSLPSLLTQPAGQLTRLRQIQLLQRWLQPIAASEVVLDSSLLSQEVATILDRVGLSGYRRDDDASLLIEHAFQRNVVTMIDACATQNVPLIVCVPVANIARCPPFKSEFDASLSSADRALFDAHLKRSMDVQVSKTERLDMLAAAHDIDPRHAGVSYRLGRLMLDSGDQSRARALLQSACDNDVCPLRITSRMTAGLRDVLARQGVIMVDIDQLFQTA